MWKYSHVGERFIVIIIAIYIMGENSSTVVFHRGFTIADLDVKILHILSKSFQNKNNSLILVAGYNQDFF